MKGLVATVYYIKQDNLDEEQKQGLDELKETISIDVKKIVEEAKEKKEEITNATNLKDLNKMLVILEDQQTGLEQRTKKVIEGERSLKRCSEKCENAKLDIMKGGLCATAEASKAFTNTIDIVDTGLQK